MSAQPRKTGEEIKSLITRIQPARQTQLKMFRGGRDQDGPGHRTKITHKILTIQPDTVEGARKWAELHNREDVVVNCEKDYMSHRDGLKTVIRYAIYTTEEIAEDPETLAEDLLS